MDKAENITDYISQFPKEVQEKLEETRKTIAKAAPAAIEAISYAIPTFVQGKNLIHFAGYKNHISVYPVPKGDEKWQVKITKYRAGKATMQFPLSRPIPYNIITEAVKWRLNELEENKKAKAVAAE